MIFKLGSISQDVNYVTQSLPFRAYHKLCIVAPCVFSCIKPLLTQLIFPGCKRDLLKTKILHSRPSKHAVAIIPVPERLVSTCRGNPCAGIRFQAQVKSVEIESAV